MVEFHSTEEGSEIGIILGGIVGFLIPLTIGMLVLTLVYTTSPKMQYWMTMKFGSRQEKEMQRKEKEKIALDFDWAYQEHSCGLYYRPQMRIMVYEALDFYDVDSLLTEEERMVRDMVRDWVDEEVVPKIEIACREGVFPDEWRVALGEMGVLGAPLKGYDCPGLSYTAYGVICRELERGDSGLRSFASVQGSLAMYPIWDFGSEEQKNKYLPKMASGEWIGCFGLTEPDYGSNPGDMITKAEDMGDHYLLNGAKMWITNGTIAELAIVWAKLDGVIRGFIVEKNVLDSLHPK